MRHPGSGRPVRCVDGPPRLWKPRGERSRPPRVPVSRRFRIDPAGREHAEQCCGVDHRGLERDRDRSRCTGDRDAVVQRALPRVSALGVRRGLELPGRRRHGVRGRVSLRQREIRYRAARRLLRSGRHCEHRRARRHRGAGARDHAHHRLPARRRHRVRRRRRPGERRLRAQHPRGPVARPADRSAGVHREHRPLRAADARVHRGRSAFGPHLRLRHRRGLPALPPAPSGALRGRGRRAAHGRVDQRRVGALDRHAIDLPGLRSVPLARLLHRFLLDVEGVPMKRALLILGVVVFLAAPGAAQWLAEPVWNRPKGGPGLTISGDYGRPDSAYGKGNAWGGRASLGLGTLTLTAGVATWKPDGATESFTSYGGNVDMRLIGGSLLPVAINVQVGVARTDSANATPALTSVTGAAGVSVPLPTPGFSIEPYFAPGIRYRSYSNAGNSTEFGYVIGANLGFGLLGVHLAYDNEKRKNLPSVGVFGVGAHVAIKLPLGM